jgi:hypothetical protein
MTADFMAGDKGGITDEGITDEDFHGGASNGNRP